MGDRAAAGARARDRGARALQWANSACAAIGDLARTSRDASCPSPELRPFFAAAGAARGADLHPPARLHARPAPERALLQQPDRQPARIHHRGRPPDLRRRARPPPRAARSASRTAAATYRRTRGGSITPFARARIAGSTSRARPASTCAGCTSTRWCSITPSSTVPADAIRRRAACVSAATIRSTCPSPIRSASTHSSPRMTVRESWAATQRACWASTRPEGPLLKAARGGPATTANIRVLCRAQPRLSMPAR